MNLEKIKEIVNSNILEEYKKQRILKELSQDPNVVNTLIELLSLERTRGKELIADLNLEVSRYNVHVNNIELLNSNIDFLNTETKNLYGKWREFISPLLNNKFKRNE